ncbi:universal stress protein [Gilvimarinus polysaccharolyticus]|uniref:universal stress protein n=1 Tax=Gilvimarinus polysaccharolyticus TaxID=863921 RepID=UPI0006737869|nr:universal stress protein [Gilvimarinus polysaccharolyticus]
MTGYKHILIAVDLEVGGTQLLTKAQALTDTAQIHLIHVEDHPVTGYGDATGHNHSVNEVQIRQTIYPKLAALADSHNIPHQNLHITFGDPAHEVHQLAKLLDIDLIITGSHGKHGLKHLLSSTSSSIHSGAKCDVLSIYTG